MNSIITVRATLPKCKYCDELAMVDAVVPHGAWKFMCLGHWLMNLEWDSPVLARERGVLLCPESQVPEFSLREFTPLQLQKMVGKDARYTMLVRGNTIVYTQGRDYSELEKEPNPISCAIDIATRLIPHESDVQDGGIKIWLKSLKGDWA